jgi:transposase
MQESPASTPSNASPPAVPFEALDHFAGFDWAADHHDVAVVDRSGAIVLQLRFEQSLEGWNTLRQKLATLGKLGVAIETSCGPAVERLLAMGHAVYPMNPKAAERYRDRKAPSGVKDDQLDAWSFADALRTDGHGWRPLVPEDQATQFLRLLCRDEIALIEQRTALVLQLRQALQEYYPAALQAFDDWTLPSPWEFVVQFPTPQTLAKAGKRRWQKFLHTHRLYNAATNDQRLAIFEKAHEFVSPSEAVTRAKSLLAVTLAKQLRTLETQLGEYRKQIQKAFDDHPDSPIFKSLPGAGDKLAPRLLAELGSQRAVFEDAQALQCYAGTAPVTIQSGRRCFQKIRRMCNMVLRATVHLWSNKSRAECTWAQAYYQQKRAEGKGHATALRALGQRWLKILIRMWRERTPYDESRHLQNMLRHGSWVLSQVPAA